jgi:hypothetical protein
LQVPPNVEGSGDATLGGNVEKLPQMKKTMIRKKMQGFNFKIKRSIQK